MRHTLLSVAILLTLVSCNRVYYAPNTPHAALLSEKDEGRINVIYSEGQLSVLNALDLQFAYAIKNHWGIMANGFFAGKTKRSGDYPEKGTGTYGEMAGGYFKKLSNSREWMVEVYSGFGGGWVNSIYSQFENSRIGVSKFFIQPSIGYKSQGIEFAYTPRLNVVNWKVRSANTTRYTEDLSLIDAHPTFFSLEQSVMVRLGAENAKVQLGFTIANPGKYLAGLKEELMLNIGVSFSFHKRKGSN